MLNFLNLVTVLWLYKWMPLFLGDTHQSIWGQRVMISMTTYQTVNHQLCNNISIHLRERERKCACKWDKMLTTGQSRWRVQCSSLHYACHFLYTENCVKIKFYKSLLGDSDATSQADQNVETTGWDNFRPLPALKLNYFYVDRERDIP